MCEYLSEEAGIPAAPAVNRLLHIADVEQAALATGILQDFIYEVGERFPLQIAGILKLIEQPVVESAVKTVIDVKPGVLPCYSTQHRSAAVLIGWGQQVLHIVEGELAAMTHHAVVEMLVLIQYAKETSCLLQRGEEFCVHDVGNQRQRQTTLFGRKALPRSFDHYGCVPVAQAFDIGNQLLQQVLDVPCPRRGIVKFADGIDEGMPSIHDPLR